LDPRFVVSNPPEDNGFLGVIKIHSMTSFGGEVNRQSHVVRFYSLLKNPTSVKQILCRQSSMAISCQVLLLLYNISVLVIARELW
jgi:hypothetical protein